MGDAEADYSEDEGPKPKQVSSESIDQGKPKRKSKSQSQPRAQSRAQSRGQSQSQRRSTRRSTEKSDGSVPLGTQQQLFLVEFLVDSVTIDACSVDEEILQGQTCLSLTFLNFPPMEICEKDFSSNQESRADKVKFNCGKSLMFAFNERQCDHPPPLAVEITVLKKLEVEESENPVRVEIGVIKICISEIFRQIVEIAKFKPEKLPASKSIKDCFMLIGPGKRTMGQVNVYIRLSCLGQNVVTEFQCGADLKTCPVLFKNREGRKMFEFTGNDPYPEGDETERRGANGNNDESQGGNRGGGQGDGGRGPPVDKSYSVGNKVVLDIPDRTESKNRSRGLDRCGDYKRSRSKMTDGMMAQQIFNPDQNIFLLKVGDKGQIPDRGKMILEFKSPKQKILPKSIPPYHEDVAVQTDSAKKGKGKGKKK